MIKNAHINSYKKEHFRVVENKNCYVVTTLSILRIDDAWVKVFDQITGNTFPYNKRQLLLQQSFDSKNRRIGMAQQTKRRYLNIKYIYCQCSIKKVKQEWSDQTIAHKFELGIAIFIFYRWRNVVLHVVGRMQEYRKCILDVFTIQTFFFIIKS